MQYEGKANHQVPSNRYAIFIDAFEKLVAQQQAKIRRAEQHQRSYMAVRDALERSKINNQVRLILDDTGVTVRIKLDSTDRPSSFMPLINDIGERLKTIKASNDGKPAKQLLTRQPTIYLCWMRFVEPWGQVALWLDMPTNGTDHCRVVHRDVMSKETVCEYHPGPGEEFIKE